MIAPLFLGSLLVFQPQNTNNFQFRTLVDACRDGAKTASQITTKDNALSAGLCVGYISAILDLQPILEKGGAPRACIPNGVAIGDVIKIIVKYGDDHPEQLYRPQDEMALKAIAAAFPCGRR